MASQAGLDVMAQGGNAVDAAIAINATLGVVLPDTCGPGGDLFAIVHLPGESIPRTLNSSGRAGSGQSADLIRDSGFGEIPLHSPWSITVPGCVDGWIALSDTLGRLDLATCLQAAIDIATDGFPVSTELATALTHLNDSLTGQPSAEALYPGGSPPAAGTVVTRPDLAQTLNAVAEGGRSAFYRGEAGAGIIEATDGAITEDDLAENQADWIEPARVEVFGRTVWTIPPNSQGYLTLATLSIFERLNPPTDPGDPLFHHLLIEAYRSVAWERAQFVTDAGTAPLSPDQLLASDRLQAIASTISRRRAGRWPMPRPVPAGTAYMAASDSDGMAVSYIQSNYHGIGSRRSAGSTGVFLHNRGAGFNLIQGHPNEYAAGRRPMHTLAPTLWTNDDQLDLVLGTRGGDQQPQFLAQFAALHYHAGLDIATAQDAPRWNMLQPKPGTDSALTVESRFDPTTVEVLADLGHDVASGSEYDQGYGPISVIKAGNSPEAAADPRISTSAALTA
jgi:gamma-glutamyltranspeptidase/glutathione hydrolase